MLLHYLGWGLKVLPHADEIQDLRVRNKKSTESLVRKGYLFLSSVKMVHPLCILVTCSKAVLDLEASPLQLFITEEADPHEASARQDESRTG